MAYAEIVDVLLTQPVTQVAWTNVMLSEIEGCQSEAWRRGGQGPMRGLPLPPTEVQRHRLFLTWQANPLRDLQAMHDFRSGPRVNEIMSMQVKGLDDGSIADVATYFGYLHQGSSDLVINGDVMRGIPPCVACHGADAGGPIDV